MRAASKVSVFAGTASFRSRRFTIRRRPLNNRNASPRSAVPRFRLPRAFFRPNKRRIDGHKFPRSRASKTAARIPPAAGTFPPDQRNGPFHRVAAFFTDQAENRVSPEDDLNRGRKQGKKIFKSVRLKVQWIPLWPGCARGTENRAEGWRGEGGGARKGTPPVRNEGVKMFLEQGQAQLRHLYTLPARSTWRVNARKRP